MLFIYTYIYIYLAGRGVRAPPTTEGRHTEARWHACARGQQLLGNLGAVRSAARTQGYPFAVLQRMAGVAARQQGGYRR